MVKASWVSVSPLYMSVRKRKNPDYVIALHDQKERDNKPHQYPDMDY